MKRKNNNTKKRKQENRSGLFIPAGLFIGMGIGFLTNQLVSGLFIGLGSGFFLMAITKVWVK